MKVSTFYSCGFSVQKSGNGLVENSSLGVIFRFFFCCWGQQQTFKISKKIIW